MLVLFETACGFAVFKVTDEAKLKKVDSLLEEFSTAKKAKSIVSLEHFERFGDANEALTSFTNLIEGKTSKKLRSALKKLSSDVTLGVADPKLGTAIKEKMGLNCVATDAVTKLCQAIRSQLPSLIPEWSTEEETAMQLAISHGLGRYKLKFSPDKVDTMIIQAISLLDDLDKELNNYTMRCKEWYGWHFPELAKLVEDNTAYVRIALQMGMRTNGVNVDMSDILPEEVEAKVKEMAEVSMGTDITEDDLINIQSLAQNVLDLTDYRTSLYEYLKKRMTAISPNLTILVGEMVGARLISHAGSLINLAKHPSSTIQILGAEKALFRALKARHDTPKYGLIYHAHLVGQSNAKNKGKMSRMLAAKASLAVRVDALSEDTVVDIGLQHRAKLESKLKFLEEGGIRKISGSGKGKADQGKWTNKTTFTSYKEGAEMVPKDEATFWGKKETESPKKRMKEQMEVGAGDELAPDDEPPKKKDKKKKKAKEEVADQVDETIEEEEPVPEVTTSKKKDKKKKQKVEPEVEEEEEVATEEVPKKKKKKGKQPKDQ